MYVIDYEYSGNNDPMWDLGDLSVEGRFGPEQDAALLHAYSAGGRRGRNWQDGGLQGDVRLLWTLWGVIQHVNGNPADDFLGVRGGSFRTVRDVDGIGRIPWSPSSDRHRLTC